MVVPEIKSGTRFIGIPTDKEVWKLKNDFVGIFGNGLGGKGSKQTTPRGGGGGGVPCFVLFYFMLFTH